MSQSQAKRRRSRLSAVKSGIDLPVNDTKALHNKIDASLPPEKKLEELTRLAIKCAADSCMIKAETEEKKEYFRDAQYTLQKAMDSPEIKELIQKACQPESSQEDGGEESMEVIDEAEQLTMNRVNRWKEEEQKWNDYIAELEAKAELAKQQEGKKTLNYSDLTSAQLEFSKDYLPSLPDLDTVSKQLDDAKKRLLILAIEHENSVHQVAQQQQRLRQQLEASWNHRAGRPSLETGYSPKTSIERLTARPNSPGLV